MQRPMVVFLLSLIGKLLTTASTAAEEIAEHKSKVADVLKDMEAHDDPALIDEVKNLANLAAAVTPPSKEDVQNASRIGEIKSPPAPKEKPA